MAVAAMPIILFEMWTAKPNPLLTGKAIQVAAVQMKGVLNQGDTVEDGTVVYHAGTLGEGRVTVITTTTAHHFRNQDRDITMQLILILTHRVQDRDRVPVDHRAVHRVAHPVARHTVAPESTKSAGKRRGEGRETITRRVVGIGSERSHTAAPEHLVHQNTGPRML